MDVNILKDKLSQLSKAKRLEVASEIKKTVINENLKLGETYLTLLPLPLIVKKEAFSKLNKRLDVLADLFVVAEKYALSSEGSDIYDRLQSSLSDGGKKLLARSNFESEFSLTRRYRRVDAFYDCITEQTGVIEVNQAAPLGTNFYDVSQKIAQYVLRELGFDYEPCFVAPRLLDWFIDEYRWRMQNKNIFPKTIALVREHGYPAKMTDLPGVALHCEKYAEEKYGEKIKIIPCYPYEISLSGNNIMLGNLKADMIWRNSVYMDSYRSQGLNISDYEKILSKCEDFLVVNSERAWLTRTKEFFALFADGELYSKLGFTEEQRKILEDIIPLTVNLNRNPEYTAIISEEKDLWISKPSDSGSGKGIVFGHSFDKDGWRTIIEDRATDGFVFQRKIKPPSIDTVIIDEDGSIENITVDYDFNPHHVNGAFSYSALVRALPRAGGEENFASMNLSAGGLLFPVVSV